MSDTEKEKHVLIVEDEKPMAKALTLKLESAGFAVTHAGNGEAALEALSDIQPVMILLDIIMPDMDGYEFIKTLRERDTTVPVVVMSNLSQEDDKDKMQDAGVERYFVKSDAQLTDIVQYVTDHT